MAPAPARNTTSIFPTIFVIFGASGDLMARKIVPALFELYKSGSLPPLFQVVGFSRRSWDQQAFREHVRSILATYLNAATLPPKAEEFLKLFFFQSGMFDNGQSYEDLAKMAGKVEGQWKVCANKLFYLAVPPEHYEKIFRHLASSGLTKPCSPEEGWTRVLVEKPFGKDLKTARSLDRLLAKLFKEIQIYRIDHYLAKEMLQNILSFRFSNNLFEHGWDNHAIEKIDIRLLEDIGVEERGKFYDGLGALKDVGQNHLLQMLALVTMEQPYRLAAEPIRQRRAELLHDVSMLTSQEIKKNTVRAQYQGYTQIKDVKTNSQTETYFKLQTYVSNPRWHRVPITIESGKRMGRRLKEIVITFFHPNPCVCPPGMPHHQNTITFQMEPEEVIKINFSPKKPGFDFATQEQTYRFNLREDGTPGHRQYIEEYSKLLLDSIRGDQTLFVSTAEVEAMWRLIDPISRAWEKNAVPLQTYQADTDTITQSELGTVRKSEQSMKKEVGIIGLGKMGANLARRLLGQGWKVIGYNRSHGSTDALALEGLIPAYTIEEFALKLLPGQPVILMLPAGKTIDEVLFGKSGLLAKIPKKSVFIDMGNSFYKDTIRREKRARQLGATLFDVGISGGPHGALYGACLMIGGKEKTFHQFEELWRALARPEAYEFFKGVGAGHFVKMVHNGIEYGMMQAIAEGFAVLNKSQYKLNLTDVAAIYNNGSVVESRLVAWLERGFELHHEELKGVTSIVGLTGEGEWTVHTARDEKIKARIIQGAVQFRKESAKRPSFMGQVLSALRNQFGGHDLKN